MCAKTIPSNKNIKELTRSVNNFVAGIITFKKAVTEMKIEIQELKGTMEKLLSLYENKKN